MDNLGRMGVDDKGKEVRLVVDQVPNQVVQKSSKVKRAMKPSPIQWTQLYSVAEVHDATHLP